MDSLRYYQSKQIIANRMKKFAAAYLQLSDASQLDPLVGLFIEALSTEIYRLFIRSEDSFERIFDKCCRVFAPDLNLNASPSHAVLHVQPIEADCCIDKYKNEFRLDKAGEGIYSFYPIYNTLLVKGDVRFIIAKGELHEISRPGQKQLIARANTLKNKFPLKIQIGLELDQSVKNLQGISFFCNFPGIPNQDTYLDRLFFARWKVADTMLDIQQGVPPSKSEVKKNVLEMLMETFDENSLNDIKTQEIYKKHFLTITNNVAIEDSKTIFPEDIQPYFKQDIGNLVDKPLVWITVDYPSDFPEEILDSLQIHTNSLIVENKKKYNLIYTKQPLSLPIVPLKTADNEYFMGMDSITDSLNRSYYPVPHEGCGTYALRYAGIERMDSREARQYIENLGDLIKRHYHFSKSGNLSSLGNLKAFHLRAYLIKTLGNILKSIHENKILPPYVLLNNKEEEQIFYLTYWATNGDKANHILQGSHLVESGLPIAVSATLLTETIGGSRPPDCEEKSDLYQTAFTETSLIMSDEDIKNYCYRSYPGYFEFVKIKNGFQEFTNNKQNTDLIRTTDVYLTLVKPLTDKNVDKTNIAYHLQSGLFGHSPWNRFYRFFIEKD